MRPALATALALSLLACSPAATTYPSGAALDAAALGVATTATSYQAGTATMGTGSDCTNATRRYADQMASYLGPMGQMAGRADSAFDGMGRSPHGDVSCSVAALTQEYDRYMAVACGDPDMAANLDAMRHHTDTVQEYANHLRMRAAELDGMGSSGMPGMGGGMAGDMGTGWTVPGGGTMSWDHHMPACAPGTTPSPPGGGTSNPPPGAPFVDPPTAPSTRSGSVVDVEVEARVGASTLGGIPATVLTYGGQFVAPVIRARRGDLLRLHFTNSLPPGGARNILGHPRFETNLHVHGLHVTPGSNPDGVAGDDVFRSVASGGGTLDYEHDLSLQPAGSMALYHPHMHGAVAEQIWGGMIGPIEIDDEPGSALAAYETHELVLKDISVTGGAPAPYDSIADYVTGKQGNLVMVNGQVNPVLGIRPGQVQRWRIFNTSTARFYRLSLEGHSLQVIGTDGGLLDRPYPVSELLVAPAERLDVLVQASATPGSFRLLALPYDRGGMGMMDGGMGGSMGGMTDDSWGASAQVTLLTLDDAGAVAQGSLPAQVNPSARRITIDPASLPRTRFVLSMRMGRGFINGVSFDEMADGTVTAYEHHSKVGTYEVWEIVNQTGMDHPWHQHVNAAQVLSVVGPDPALAPYADLYTHAPGMKDTVIVPKGGSITLLVPVLDHAGKTVFHCHLVEHEDIGMMGIWQIDP